LDYEGFGEKLCEWCILLLLFPGLENDFADLRSNVVKFLTVRPCTALQETHNHSL
jgi:hypothetical protein